LDAFDTYEGGEILDLSGFAQSSVVEPELFEGLEAFFWASFSFSVYSIIN